MQADSSDSIESHLAPDSLGCPEFVRTTIALSGTVGATSALCGGQGPVLLLVPGGVAAGAASFFPIPPALATRYRVVAVDLSGCGFTPELPAADGPDAFGRWLIALLDVVQPAAVVAASIGGALALHVLARSSQPMAPVVLVGSPALTAWRPRLVPALAMAAFALVPARLSLWLLARASGARVLRSPAADHFVAGVLLAMRRRGGRRFLRRLQPFTRGADPSRLRALAAEGRVCGLWGRDDPFVEMHRLPHWLKVTAVPMAGHYPFMDQPQAFVKALLPILDAMAVARASAGQQ